jgi:hypothetical protein
VTASTKHKTQFGGSLHHSGIIRTLYSQGYHHKVYSMAMNPGQGKIMQGIILFSLMAQGQKFYLELFHSHPHL